MADIQSLLGDEYREGMTIEEINAVLANRQFVDPTTLPKSVEKSIFDKTASELAKVKKELGELKNSNLTGEEKVKGYARRTGCDTGGSCAAQRGGEPPRTPGRRMRRGILPQKR